MHCFGCTIFQLIYRKTGTDNPPRGWPVTRNYWKFSIKFTTFSLKVLWLVGIVWRSLKTCLFPRAERLVHNSWQSQHVLAANCWRVLLMELPSLGIEVNVGREWVDKEAECLSRKTEIDMKMHSFLKPEDDITFGQVEGTFFIRRPTDWKGQHVWNRAVWFNVVPQPDFTQNWGYTCYPLSFLAALCFGSLLQSTVEEDTWSSMWKHLRGTAAEIWNKCTTRGHLLVFTAGMESCSQLQNVRALFAAKGKRSWSSEPPTYNFYFL